MYLSEVTGERIEAASLEGPAGVLLERRVIVRGEELTATLDGVPWELLVSLWCERERDGTHLLRYRWRAAPERENVLGRTAPVSATGVGKES